MFQGYPPSQHIGLKLQSPGLQAQVLICMLQARAGPPKHRATGLNCRTWRAGNYPRKWHPRVTICSLPITGCWGFPSLSSLSLVSSLFFHVEITHFVSRTAEEFWWRNKSAGSAHADKHDACFLSIMQSALSTRMYYFFPMHSHIRRECGRTKCHHCAL